MGKLNGRLRYKKVCATCRSAYRRSGAYYTAFKKETCEICGFVPKHASQLDVDHKDGNPLNDNPDNLQMRSVSANRGDKTK